MPTAIDTQLDVTADLTGERLDVAIARLCELTRAQARRLIDEGLVSDAAGVRRKAGEKLSGGEQLSVVVPAPVPAEPQPEAVALTIYFEDDNMLVVEKPAGMPVHPGPGHSGNTLVNALLAHCPDLPGIGGVQRPGIVHRLDKDTSGLIMVAKTERAHNGLARMLADREIHKTYLTLVEGRMEQPTAMIEASIGRDSNNRRRMTVNGVAPREAQTSYKVRSEYSSSDGPKSLVEASPVTGRTHQIRVHFASLGHPVVADALYGRPSRLLGRQFLHAWRLTFNHPIDGRELTFTSELPADLKQALVRLESQS